MAVRILIAGIAVSVVAIALSLALTVYTNSMVNNLSSLGNQNLGSAGTTVPQSSVPGTTPSLTYGLTGGATFSWTVDMTSSAGASATVELDVGNPQPFQSGTTNGDATAGSACSLSALTDEVIPAIITLTNTSANMATIVGANFAGIGSGSIPSFTGPELIWEAAYAGGPQCTGQDGNSSTIDMYTSNAIAAGARAVTDGFFDITNYFPSASSGSSVMADTILTVPSTFTVTNAAGSTTVFNITNVSGPGVVQTSSGWEFTLAGTSPAG